MSSYAIQVRHLGKQYRLGLRESYKALRDVLSQAMYAPFRRMRAIARRQPRSNAARETIWALEDVSFDVQHGEVLGIIGRNGAGKSTLLKILSRITDPTTGVVDIYGRVGSLLEVGTGFHPELTGRENIYLNGAILGMKRVEIERKFDEIVDFAEIERFIDTPVKHYSSGMYMRLAFSVAAHLEPEILVIDEVLAVGDIAFQKKCLGKMGDVARQGRTVLFVSHNLPTIQALCQRVILLQNGHLTLSGSPDEVISHYMAEGLNVDAAEVDLRASGRRSHSQEPALIRAWILNGRGEKTNQVLMGEEIQICFEFDCSRPVINPIFGFGIEDEHARRIFSLNNHMKPETGNTFSSLRQGVACLRIPSLPLLPGTYHASLSLVEDQREWVDFVEQAISLQVQPADVYGSGKLPERSQGLIFIPGSVSCIPVETAGFVAHPASRR